MSGLSSYKRFRYDRFRDGGVLPQLECADPEDARWIRARGAANTLGIHALIHLLVEKHIVDEGDLLHALEVTGGYEQRARLFEHNETFARNVFMHAGGAEAVTVLGRAAKLTPADYVLEVGIGCGAEARQLYEEFGCKIVGLEHQLVRICESILMTRSLGLDRRIDFKLGDANDMPFDNAAFDVVWIQGFPFGEKWGNPVGKILAEAARVLKPQGRLAMVAFQAEADAVAETGLTVVYRDAALSTCWEAKTDDPTPYEEGTNALVMLVAEKA